MTGTHAGRQASRKAGMQVDRQAGRQAVMQACGRAGSHDIIATDRPMMPSVRRMMTLHDRLTASCAPFGVWTIIRPRPYVWIA